VAGLFVAAAVSTAAPITFPKTGRLSSPEDFVLFELTLGGGGANAAFTVIPPGGLDPFLDITPPAAPAACPRRCPNRQRACAVSPSGAPPRWHSAGESASSSGPKIKI
jgi:hypothetical protein